MGRPHLTVLVFLFCSAFTTPYYTNIYTLIRALSVGFLCWQNLKHIKTGSFVIALTKTNFNYFSPCHMPRSYSVSISAQHNMPWDGYNICPIGFFPCSLPNTCGYRQQALGCWSWQYKPSTGRMFYLDCFTLFYCDCTFTYFSQNLPWFSHFFHKEFLKVSTAGVVCHARQHMFYTEQRMKNIKRLELTDFPVLRDLKCQPQPTIYTSIHDHVCEFMHLCVCD